MSLEAFAIFLAIALGVIAAGAIVVLRWLRAAEDEPEDTVWVDPGEWRFLHRLFAAKPLRIGRHGNRGD